MSKKRKRTAFPYGNAALICLIHPHILCAKVLRKRDPYAAVTEISENTNVPSARAAPPFTPN